MDFLAERHGGGLRAVLDLTPNQVLGMAFAAQPPKTFATLAEAKAYAARRKARLGNG